MSAKKIMRIITTALIFVMAVTIFSTIVFATDDGLSIGFSITDRSGASKAAKSTIGALINIAQVIGVGVAIIMLIVLAIKYMSAAPEEKAEIKKSATVYIFGAVILFASVGILQIIKNFAGNVNNAGASFISGYQSF